MKFIETIIAKKLKEIEPTLNVQGADRKVLQIAQQDFINYVKFNLNFVSRETSNFELALKLEKSCRKDPVEFDSFLTVWTGIWLKKWKTRFKLIIGNQTNNELPKNFDAHSNCEDQWIKLSCKEELIEILLSALLRNGEVCGTEVLATNLLKKELGKNENLNIKDIEHLLAVLNNTLRKAHELSETVGPLIFVKVDKKYYEEVDN